MFNFFNKFKNIFSIKKGEMDKFTSPPQEGLSITMSGEDFSKSHEELLEREPLSKQRYEICKSCDHFIKETKMCNECYCFMPIKVRFSGLSCPLKKW
jgi:hypothetical protein